MSCWSVHVIVHLGQNRIKNWKSTPIRFVLKVSAHLKLQLQSIRFFQNKSIKHSFSKLRSERSKAKPVKSRVLEKQQHARIEKHSLWCARDSWRRKYDKEWCSKRLASKRNLTWVKDSINHQDLLNSKMRLYSPWGKQQDWGRHFVPFCFKDKGGGKGLGWISKGYSWYLNIHWDCTGGTAAIKDLHNLKREDEQDTDTKEERQRQRDARSSYACLPKTTTCSAQEGEGIDGRQRAERVPELKLKAASSTTSCLFQSFLAKLKKETG